MASPTVWIVGSHRPSNSGVEGEHAQFAECVRMVVRELRTKHDVQSFIVCSLSASTADKYVLEELSHRKDDTRVRVIYPEDDVDADFTSALSGFVESMKPASISAVGVGGGWRPTHLRALRESDLVVAISGSPQGTGTVIYSAEVLGVPVVVIPTFGGAAKQAWRDFKRFYTDAEQVGLMCSITSSDWAGRVVSSALSIRKRNPFAANRAWFVVVAAFVTLLAVGGWLAAWAYTQAVTSSTAAVCFIALGLVLSAFVGHVLGSISSVGTQPPSAYLPYAVASLALALAVLVTADAASLVVTGRATVLGIGTSEAQSAFVRLSAVALLAGLLPDRFIGRLLSKARGEGS